MPDDEKAILDAGHCGWELHHGMESGRPLGCEIKKVKSVGNYLRRMFSLTIFAPN